jgi:uncharacterized protein YecE (DUF72 family)
MSGAMGATRYQCSDREPITAAAQEKAIVRRLATRYPRAEVHMAETRAAHGSIHIGPAGWSYADWVGPVYPAGRKVDELLTIARFFDVIELNSSFYRTPSERLVRSWAERIAERPGFRFTVKVLQRFTHEREGTADEAERFIRVFDPLIARGAVGALLLQFPWSFRDSAENRRYLADLAGWFRELPTAVELRHGSWNAPDTAPFLEECRVALCNIDQPVIGSSMPPTEIATDPRLAYIRLHGRNYRNWMRRDAGRDERYDYLYPERELEQWKERAQRLAAKAEHLYIITNNHFRGQAVVNAFQLRSMLEARAQEMPRTLVAAYPVLRDIATEPPGQRTLL